VSPDYIAKLKEMVEDSGILILDMSNFTRPQLPGKCEELVSVVEIRTLRWPRKPQISCLAKDQANLYAASSKSSMILSGA